MGFEAAYFIQLAWFQWLTFVNTMMDFGFHVSVKFLHELRNLSRRTLLCIIPKDPGTYREALIMTTIKRAL
jgi:hypothetical protein